MKNNQNNVTTCLFFYHQALSVARQLGATTYVETSARASSKGVKDAFEVAALAALGKLNKQQIKQQVMYIHLINVIDSTYAH